jgi:hypothetical protein
MWYWASLFFQSVHNDCPTDHDLWELQVVLIQSHSETNAMTQAEQIGKRKEHEYVSATGDRVCWVFRHVESVFQLFDQHLNPGTEVYSRFLRANDVINLMKPFDDDGGSEKDLRDRKS